MEAVFQQVQGVSKVISGYSGGHVVDPSYEQVCSETTGHAEVVQISYDQKTIGYENILDIFFSIHDPTTLNRQGYDVGSSYRSVIFYHTSEQHIIASDKVKELNESKIWNSALVTEIVPLNKFYPAEEYHQGYYLRNETQPYCQMVISPKLAKFRKEHLDKIG